MTTRQKKLSEPTRDILKGALAGLIGGLIATAAKSAAEKVYPPHEHGEPEPRQKKFLEESLPWVLGATAGAAYGALAEIYPQVTDKYGANFGMTLMAVTHEGPLHALGLATHPELNEAREQRSEVVTHVVYGVVCETVRGLVRRSL